MAGWLYAWIGLAAVLFVVQLRITPGYGRHVDRRWGVTVPNRFGWFVMESVALAAFLAPFVEGKPGPVAAINPVVVLAAVLWCCHYVHRAIIYPFKIRTRGKTMPLIIMFSAVLFNAVNGFVNGNAVYRAELQNFSPQLADLRTVSGAALFVCGMAINIWADQKLINLRTGAEQGYQIPYGGLYRWISCPNFFGEIVQWSGFALLCWNLPSLAFAVWTVSNLLPRALAHHRWYRAHFADYPPDRRAVLPGIL